MRGEIQGVRLWAEVRKLSGGLECRKKVSGATAWRNRSPHILRPIQRWQPCSSKGLSRGTPPTAPPTSTWPSSGLNHPRHRSAGTSSHELWEETGTLCPLPEKRLAGRRE